MLPRSKSTSCMPLMYLRSEDAHCKNLQACFEKISDVLREYPYAQKIHELTKLYVFSFDIRKVVVKENSSGITSKIMLSTWDSRHNSQNPPIPPKSNHPSQQNPQNPKSLRSTSQQIPNSLTNSLNETNPNCQAHNYTNTKTNTKINVEGNGGTSVSAEKIQEKKEIGQSGKLEGEEPVLVQIMVKACADIKEAYCELTQSYNKMIVKRLEILCFIVALMGPIVLEPLMQTIQTQLCCKHQDHPNNPNNPNTSSSSQPPNSLLPPPLPSCTNSIIQQQLFIILNFYTLGNLISNNAFSYLHKKYIKLVIPRVENKFVNFQLQKSLKVIKHRVEENKATVCKIRSFRNLQNDKGITKRSSLKLQDKENMWSLKKIKKFIKQALKIKQDTVLQSTNHIQPKADPRQQSISKLQQALYPTHPTKQSLLQKQDPLNKHILSSSQPHNLKFTILNTSSSCSQQKKNTSSSSTSYYYKNNKQLNYKIKKPSQKINKINRSSLKENALVVNTQRKQGKFKKISKIYPVNHNCTMSPLSANHCHGEKQKVKEEAIQVIKVKLKGFKDYAIQDRASIERFQPFSRKKENKYRFSFQNNVTQTFDSVVQSKRQTQIQNPRKQIILQKLQRTQDFITPNPNPNSTTNPQSQPRNPSPSPPTHQYKSFNYPNQNPNRPPFNETNLRSSQKLAKISRNFKKDKQLFMNGCRKRQEVIFQDSNQRVKFDYI